MGLIGSNHEPGPGRRGFGSEACDAKAWDAQAALCRALCCGLFFIAFLASKPGSEVSNTEEPCDGMARHMARPNGAPMPSGCAGGSFASRAEACVVVCSSRSDALYMERVPSMAMCQKSPQATVGTRGRVISPCVQNAASSRMLCPWLPICSGPAAALTESISSQSRPKVEEKGSRGVCGCRKQVCSDACMLLIHTQTLHVCTLLQKAGVDTRGQAAATRSSDPRVLWGWMGGKRPMI